MTLDRATWDCLPVEIRRMVLDLLLQDGCSLASLATVSREWQTVIERHNFSRIKLTMSRLADFGSIIHRNRALVSYLWLCLELEEYDCSRCAPHIRARSGVSNADNILITAAFQDLFSTLSTWEPSGELLLDISVHSRSDSEHWFKYLTFEPDSPSDECNLNRRLEQAMSVRVVDPQHRSIAAHRNATRAEKAIYKVFDQIMGGEPFDDDEQEDRWWQQLPSVPAVTGVLLRQQTRRRWRPEALAHMFSHFPRLQEIHYEPWRKWHGCQNLEDRSYRFLFKSLTSSNLRTLVLFENFNEQYALRVWDCEPFRLPTLGVSQKVAKASLKLECLSASFMVDANYFFHARASSWEWPNLTSLALTSQVLKPTVSPADVDYMLRSAAAAAKKMPKLETMELWNGRKGLAMLFRYQSIGGGQPAVLSCRGTWELALQPRVIRAWEAVARKHGGNGCVVVRELLGPGTVIKSHGDAIHFLNISKPVIRPISLQQIRIEHRIRGGVHNL
ncbi:hypothetical protein EDB81DRAFT_652426 [Dactylonectria macrodidyma]|uniref:DUF6546 domain-containing protein n=1 Tax=Dactylonectria macrodidyma TaxID=307937 RepID=A0A9P9J2H0_9HYPO|nr:hypothetical protein EDB81DRAFT_652426 [Dactylonectria macrodidyma]